MEIEYEICDRVIANLYNEDSHPTIIKKLKYDEIIIQTDESMLLSATVICKYKFPDMKDLNNYVNSEKNKLINNEVIDNHKILLSQFIKSNKKYVYCIHLDKYIDAKSDLCCYNSWFCEIHKDNMLCTSDDHGTSGDQHFCGLLGLGRACTFLATT